MTKFLKLGIKALLAATILTVLLAGAALAAEIAGPEGPAPNAGDCDPDGSGMDSPYGPVGIEDAGEGPAPNSGDGDPDGSGF